MPKTKSDKWIIKKCANCGKEFSCLKSKETKYCSPECRSERGDKYIAINCDFCGKEFKILKSRYDRCLSKNQKTFTCSKECGNEIKHSKILVECSNCGKQFYKTKYQANRQENHFCSVDCQNEYRHSSAVEIRHCEICGKNLKHIKNLPKDFVQYNVKENGNQRKSEYLIQDSLVKKYNVNIVERNITKKNIKQTKINIIFVQKNVDKNGIQKYGHNVKSGKNIQETSCYLLSSGKINTTNSKPQIMTNNILDEMKINYENELNIKYYAIDNYLIDNNLMIEVQGDYWHCNPLKYKDYIYPNQYNKIKSDKAKHTYVKKYYNVEILYLWESDIYNNTALCKQLILQYIKNDGDLKNYHSFNYYLNENEQLCLLPENKLILPYQDRDVSEYRHLVKDAS